MEDGNGNYEIFRDCMSATVLSKFSRRPTKKPKKRVPRGQGVLSDLTKSEVEVQLDVAGAEDDPAELAEFIEVSFLESDIRPELESKAVTVSSN
jgi:hypothetical protein